MIAHCTPVLVSASSLPTCGAAIETIVWSMNVIDTAKIIAARIRLRGCLVLASLAAIDDSLDYRR